LRSVKFVIKALVYAFLFVVLIGTAFPIVYSILASLKSNQEILTAGVSILPKHITFENYKQAWLLADFSIYTWNSVYMSFFVVAGVLFTSTMAGYVFSRGKFVGKKIIFAIFASTMFVSLGSFVLFPLLNIAKALHLNTTIWGVIVIKIFGLNITNIYLVRAYINSLPMELDEAAKIDGYNFFRIFIHIISPLLKPVIATIGLITFQSAWNDYLLPMVFTLANPKQAPLVVGIVALRNTGEAASSWNLMLAGTVISIVPLIIVYLFLNRYFIEGLTTGAVKG